MVTLSRNYVNPSRKDSQLCKIYKLTNLINNKIYIGQTWLSLQQRGGKSGNKYNNSTILYNAIKKYGYDNFKYTILYSANKQDEADAVEFYYINKLQTQYRNIGYNIKNGGRGGRHSQVSKDKISQSLLGRVISKESLKRMSIAQTGIPKPKSLEVRKQVSETMTKWHAKHAHPLLGVPRTSEQKQSQSEKLRGRSRKPEYAAAQTELLRKKYEMTPRDELEIIDLYNSGKSFKYITTRLQINNRKIYRVFKKYNIESRSKNCRGRITSMQAKLKQSEAAKRRWENHNIRVAAISDDIIKDHQNKMTFVKLKKKYKISIKTIYLILRQQA